MAGARPVFIVEKSLGLCSLRSANWPDGRADIHVKVRSGFGLILRTSSGPSSRTDDTVIGAGHHVVLAKRDVFGGYRKKSEGENHQGSGGRCRRPRHAAYRAAVTDVSCEPQSPLRAVGRRTAMIGVRVRGLAVPPRPPVEAEHQMVKLLIGYLS